MPGGRGRVRPLAIAALVGVVAMLRLGSPVLADNGPHDAAINSGSQGLAVGTCGACHRAHAASGPDLLNRPASVQVCLTCHGSAAAGATTNVVDGVMAGTAQGLKGGGFENATMDTAWTANAVSRPTTSAHLVDGTTPATMWGSGAVGSGPGKTSITLTCTSCHNPHGNGSYRILRPIPTGSDATAPITVSDDQAKVYTVSSAQNRYFGELYWPIVTTWGVYYDWEKEYTLVQWCAQCHTRYDAVESGTGHINSGDPIFTYRHMTRYPTGSINCDLCHPGSGGSISASNPFGITGNVAHEGVCENCHVAHGTSATMGASSGTVEWPGALAGPTGNARSSLLRLDNRGVCIGCHDPWR